MRQNGLTNTLLEETVDELKKIVPKSEVERIQISDVKINVCKVSCNSVCSNNPYQCVQQDDFQLILNQMKHADMILLGAPQYFRAPPAQFHVLIERLVASFFNYECSNPKGESSPVHGKLCGIIATAEYSNPYVIMEYLADFCRILKMRNVVLDNFPYLGVAGQRSIEETEIFHPHQRCKELAQKLVNLSKVLQ